MRKLKSVLIGICSFLLIFTGVYVPESSAATSDYVNVTRSVNPNSIIIGEEAEVTLSIQGTPPVNVVKPNDVILIIDKSGSMTSENKMASARDAAKGFIDLMDLNVHRVGIVDFSSTNNIGLFPLGTDATAAKDYISKINANGGTATGAAIDKAIAELQNVRDEAQPVIVIMTDGDATEPSGNAYQYALQKANEAKEQGIVFYTIALLNSTDDPNTSKPNLLLKDMATTSSHHHFVLGSTGLSAIYAAIVKEIGIASAYDVTVRDTVAPEFEIVPGSYDHNIPKPDVIGNTLTWKFNELKDKTLTLSYKIRPVTDTKPGNYNVASGDSAITYKDYAGATRTKYTPNAVLKLKLPAPFISSITPAEDHPKGGSSVVIEGGNFIEGAKVAFGDISAANTTFIDANRLEVVTPAGKQGTVEVKVTNPDAQFATSSFKYKTDPVISSIDPATGPFEGGNVVTVLGNYFMPGIQVLFGDKPGTIQTNLSATYLKVVAPPAEISGPVDLQFINPDGSKAVVSQGYTYQEKVVPKIEITSVSPDKGLTTGGETVYINGKMFASGLEVYFGDTKATGLTYYNDKQIKVVAPSSSVPGPVDIKVVNPDGQEAVLTQAYTYEEPPKQSPPTITSLTPNQGLLTGGEIVYVNGTNFSKGIKVYFGLNEATVLSNTSGKILTVTVPKGDADGVVDVKVVTTDNQESVLPLAYTYYTPLPDPMTITSISPNEGTVVGGDIVYINGTNFKSGMIIEFNGVRGTVNSISSSTSASVTVPASSVTGPVDVVVKNRDGGSGTLPQGYTYLPVQPKITALNPNKVTNNKGGIVYVSGVHFERNMSLTVGGMNVPFAFTNDRSFNFNAPVTNAVGDVPVIITLANGQTASATLTYEAPPPAPAPIITSMSLTSGKAGDLVYIYAKNMTKNMKVYFGNTEAVVFSQYSSSICVYVPSGTAGDTVQVQIVNNENVGSNTLAFTYK